MCWECDHPGATRDDYLHYVGGVIAEHGWAVQGVERDRIHPPWAYTVGLTEHGEPELVVTRAAAACVAASPSSGPALPPAAGRRDLNRAFTGLLNARRREAETLRVVAPAPPAPVAPAKTCSGIRFS